MATIFHEKVFSSRWFISYTLIVIGSFILAAGFVFFITPYKIVPGGVYGICIVVHYLTKGMFTFFPDGLPVGTMGLIMNIPLTMVGIKVLGPRFGSKTVIGFVLCSVFMDLLTSYWGDVPLVNKDPLLSSIFGGVLCGFGLGLIFKSKATSGGSDIVAMILAKYTHLPLGQLMIYVDSFIVLFGLAVFKDWAIPLYSWIVIFITGKVIDVTLQGVSYDKALFIISEKFEEIRDKILVDLDRGGTYIPGTGMYKGDSKTIIFTVVNRRELAVLEEYIHQLDPKAFVTVIQAGEILGEGFRSLQEKVNDN
ncbi:MAG: YitT family protein [Bacteroidetes bacterium]|nr:YitT family protein [Bacteroidota bacterium]